MKFRILIIILIVSFTSINAQSLFLDLTNGTSEEYPLSTISKITFTSSDMVLHKTDASIISWAITDIRKYYYDISTQVKQADTKDKMETLIFPNPAKDNFSISLNLEKTNLVNISLHNLSGKLIKTIVSEKMIAGDHLIQCEKSNLKPGMYLVKIISGNKMTNKKIIIL